MIQMMAINQATKQEEEFGEPAALPP